MLYTNNDLDGWEFKIVRADMGEFGQKGHLRAMMRQESKAGWLLVEKYDDKHVRLKRPLVARDWDAYLPPGVDPYCTSYTMSPNRQFMQIACLYSCLTVCLALMWLLVFIVGVA